MAKCKVIAHRGANKVAPQNTIPAFEKALEIGCDGFETDIHLTLDGFPVICHNYSINDTSTGEGDIRKLSLEELRKYDFGSYFHDKFKGTQIPKLEEFLTLTKNSDIEIMNIEIKPPLDGNYTIVEKTINMVKEYGLFDRLIISSFSSKVLIECKRVDPECKTGLLYSPERPITNKKMLFSYLKYAKELKVDYLHPHHLLVTKKYVETLHANGNKVNVWTVNKPELAQKLLGWGVDGLITDLPQMANDIIERFESSN